MLPRPSWSTLAAALPLVLAAAAPGTATADPLAVHRWKDRVLLVVAEHADDPKLRDQREIFRDMGRDAGDRDLQFVVMAGNSPDAAALRRRFGVGPGFHALLIGKDGGAKLTAATPLRPDVLLPLIDAMPMRQEEMRQRS